MNQKLSLCSAALLAASCGPGTDVSSFPDSLANDYCHFLYHCCTPADRADVDPANPFNVTGLEQQYDFDNESDCGAKLGVSYQIGFQPQQTSVKDKRMSYNETAAQSCLDALSNAASSCDPAAFVAATAKSDAPCDTSTFFTGLVVANATCTMDADCATLNSVCSPLVADGGPPLVSSAGACTPPPGIGDPCVGICGAGAACFAGSGGSVCSAYLAEGASCASGPCDPSKDYCSSTGTCTTLIANGGTCAAGNFGADCLSENCDNATNTCQPLITATLEVCQGNPDGL